LVPVGDGLGQTTRGGGRPIVQHQIKDQPDADPGGARRALGAPEDRLDQPGRLQAVPRVVARRETRLDVHHPLGREPLEHRLGETLEVPVLVEEAALPHPALDELVERPKAESGPQRVNRPERGDPGAAHALEEPGQAHRAVPVRV